MSDERVDLTKLIDYSRDFATKNASSYFPNAAERDEIVLALRVLRVLRHDGCYGSRNTIQGMKFDVYNTGEGYSSWHSLTDAERLLGLAGKDGE